MGSMILPVTCGNGRHHVMNNTPVTPGHRKIMAVIIGFLKEVHGGIARFINAAFQRRFTTVAFLILKQKITVLDFAVRRMRNKESETFN